VRNEISLSEIIKHDYKAIILSPGPETPEKAGSMLNVIEYYYKTHPMLGICLGHQAIGEFFGGALTKAEKPMHGKISEINFTADYIFDGLRNSIKVVRYHSLILKELPNTISVLAWTKAGEIMAIKHNKYPIRGLQFHPEAVLTIDGLQLLKNWAFFNKII
jgi:anthranilate synthase component 2